jgi:chlorophyllide a reductase subunit Y
MLAPLGLAAGPVVPPRMARALRRARLRGGRRDPSLLHAAIREFEAAGPPIVGSAPVGHDGTAAWLAASARPRRARETRSPPRRTRSCPRSSGALAENPIKGTITLSGYEGSELAGRAAADRKRRGRALCRHRLSEDALVRADAEWLEAHGAKVKFRASLEQDDCAAMEAIKPDLAIGTTPVVQKAKEKGIPALYFTNLISARPLMGRRVPGSAWRRWSTPPWATRTGWTT